MAIASINPATGEKLKDFTPFDDAEIEKRLSRAEKSIQKLSPNDLSRTRGAVARRIGVAVPGNANVC
jgi:acyl-CoA reductase-like NAD-dependent aldehyde dehydrogenase